MDLGFFWAVYFLSAAGGLMAIAHAVPIVDALGGGAVLAPLAPTLNALGNVLGSLVGGVLVGRMGLRLALAVPVAVLMVSLLVVAHTVDPAAALTGRYLSLAEREDLAILRAQGSGVREIGRQMGRFTSSCCLAVRGGSAAVLQEIHS
jgi:MFS family permease